MDNSPIRACIDYFPGSNDITEALELAGQNWWTSGQVLRVCFLDGLTVVQNRVAAIAQLWCQFANIKFAFTTEPDAEIRIAFQTGGSWSTVGRDALKVPLSQPTMNFGWLTPATEDHEYQRVVLHEFGHALGCIHEHQNPAGRIPWNKPAVYAYYAGAPNYWTPSKVDRNLLDVYDEEQTQFSDFDPHSIMLYPIPKALTFNGFEVSWNRELSATDKAFIQQVYPFPVSS